MEDTLVRAVGLGKRYRLSKRQGYRTLREAIGAAGAAPLRWLAGRQGRSADSHVWALRHASFEVRRGEVVGLVGANGAGKSTLLKLLGRVTEPTEGYAEVRGRVGSLLEVGTGFHPELTGRENISLGGAVLGLSRREIQRRFDEIVAFSGVEKFLDTPVKHFSSGMYMRLAFAVAAHLEPDVLLVDEVLAVGDAVFQNKCLGKMDQLARGGRTVLFVSHNLSAVRNLCRRAVWLTDGGIRSDGPVETVVAQYLESVRAGFAQDARAEDQLVVERVVLKNSRGQPTLEHFIGDDLTVEVHYFARARIEKPYFVIWAASQHGSLFVASMLFDGIRPDSIEGAGQLSCTFKAPPLLPQIYTLGFAARASDGITPLLRSKDIGFFKVIGRLRDVGLTGDPGEALIAESTPLILPYEWTLPCGRRVAVSVRSHTRRS